MTLYGHLQRLFYDNTTFRRAINHGIPTRERNKKDKHIFEAEPENIPSGYIIVVCT